MALKPPSVATWISYWIPATGPLSVASIQLSRTGPEIGLSTWMSRLCGSSATGSVGATWSLRKSGLFVLGASSVPNASTHAHGRIGLELPNASSTRQRQSYAPSAGMVYSSVFVPWLPNAVCRVVTWFAWFHWALWGFTWTRKITCWFASGSVTSAENVIVLSVQPSNFVVSACAWSPVSARLPVCARLAGAWGGEPKFGGVNSSHVV